MMTMLVLSMSRTGSEQVQGSSPRLTVHVWAMLMAFTPWEKMELRLE